MKHSELQMTSIMGRLRIFFVIIAIAVLFDGIAMGGEAFRLESIRVSNVKVEPISPWGKVFVAYDVIGNMPTNAEEYVASLLVSNTTSKMSFVATAISGQTELSPGRHVVVWDVAEEGLSSNVDVVINVKYDFGKYCIVDLEQGCSADSYSVHYLDHEPDKSDARFRRLVLRRIEMSEPAGILSPYYIGVFELTHAQLTLITGSVKSDWKGCPANDISYPDAIDMAKTLTRKTGLSFSLPTIKQWQYACRAGKNGCLFHVGSDIECLKTIAWYRGNTDTTRAVGALEPNKWGLYDFHGNVREWGLGCVEADYYDGDQRYARYALGGGCQDDWYGNKCDSIYRMQPYVSRPWSEEGDLFDMPYGLGVGVRFVINL